MKKIKRLCLFAGYDSKGVILNYVIHYVKAMSKLADVYYMADCEMAEEELEKLAPYTIARYALRHKKYDFGSWQELILRIGWEKVAEYDELILCNDSCFGPLNNSLPYIFEKASNDSECDFWGASAPLDNQHISSYFMVLKKHIFVTDLFKNFISNINIEKSKEDICLKYELGINKLFKEAGFKPKQIVDILGDVYEIWDKLIKIGFPLLKSMVLFSSIPANKTHAKIEGTKIYRDYKIKISSIEHFDEIIEKYTSYNIDYIYEYLNHIGLDINTIKKPHLAYKIGQKRLQLKRFRHFIYRKVNKHKDRNLLQIFGKVIYNKGAMKPLLTYKELKEISK